VVALANAQTPTQKVKENELTGKYESSKQKEIR
jgi:hypothetical protein